MDGKTNKKSKEILTCNIRQSVNSGDGANFFGKTAQAASGGPISITFLDPGGDTD